MILTLLIGGKPLLTEEVLMGGTGGLTAWSRSLPLRWGVWVLGRGCGPLDARLRLDSDFCTLGLPNQK